MSARSVYLRVNQQVLRTGNRWKEIVFHGYFLFMFILAFHFFKERLYADSSYYIFNTIDSGFFVTPHQRIVLAFSEIVPLLFFYAGASLKTILVAWSLGHVLFYYAVFLVAFYKFKNEAGALAVILLNVIGQTWLYFSPMLEICYGAALLVLFKILLDENILTRLRWCWLILLEIFVLTSHPENFVIFFFVLGYDILKNGFRKSPHLALFLIFVATIVFKTQTFSEYEGGKIHFMTDTHQNHLYENLFRKEYLSGLWKLFSGHYPDLMLLFLVTLIALIAQKKMLRPLFLFGTITGLLILVNVTNFARDYSRYNESLYYPLVAITGIAFTFEVYQSAKLTWKIYLLSGCMVIAIGRISGINTNGDYLSCRTIQLEALIRKAHELDKGKCIVNMGNAEPERWNLNWSYPIESILLSSLAAPDSTVSLVPDEDYTYRDTSVQLTAGKTIIRRWEIRDNQAVLPFFKFRKEDYFAMNTLDTVTPADFFPGKFKLVINEQAPGYYYDRLFFSVTIANISGKTLSSLPAENCFLKIRCEQNGKITESQIPLDIDLYNEYIQTLSCPLEKNSGETGVTTKLFRNGVELVSAYHRFNL